MSLEDEIAALLAGSAGPKPPDDSKSQPSQDSTIEDDLHKSLSAQGRSPLSQEEIAQRIAAFSQKWSGKAEGTAAFNLLLSPYENDFSGMVRTGDTKAADGLVQDIYEILGAEGKVDSLKKLSFADLFSSLMDSAGDSEPFPQRTLVVLTSPEQLGNIPDQLLKIVSGEVFDKMAHIVDGRYILVVGTEEALDAFLGCNRSLRFLFGEHIIALASEDAAKPGDIDTETPYAAFLECVAPELAAQIDDDFKGRFEHFVRRNARDLPFKGRELGDYLAKQCNASNTLTLPAGRSFNAAQAELDAMIGLGSVKRAMHDIAKYAVIYGEDKNRGLNPPEEKFHMIFSGPPGTGKTTVAKLVAPILYEAGIISSAKYTRADADKLVNPAIGGTSIKTREVIDKAKGGVLFIDEAYVLAGTKDHDNPNGADAIAALLTAMEEEDIVIILAGYRDEMEALVKSNPGFKSRISFTLDFEAFTPAELMQVFDKLVQDAGFTKGEGVDAAIEDLIGFFSPQRNFGNARFMRSVFHKAYINRAVRLFEAPDDTQASAVDVIEAQDIPTITQMMDYEKTDGTTAQSEIDNLVGLDEVKKKLKEFSTFVRYREEARRQGLKSPKQTMHMVFSGNPGTGKTTVARIVAKVLFENGVTATPRFTEVSAQNLIGRYVGETGGKTKTVLENAIGGVLFIDEAYALSYNSEFGQDAIAEIVKFMEDYRDQSVIIFAGYSDEMEELLKLNPGLASRIGFQFQFKDYDAEELLEIFKRKMAGMGYACTPAALASAEGICKYFHNVENFGNGRFVDKLAQEVLLKHAERYQSGAIATIDEEDIPSKEEMCKTISLPVREPSPDNRDQKRVAVHEMGHAIVGLDLMGMLDIKTVTIEEEATGTLGYVEYEQNAFSGLQTRKSLLSRMAICMGGMAAERLFLGDYSAGNSSDLEKATNIALACAVKYGMTDAGYMSYDLSSRQGSHLPDIASMPEEVRTAAKNMLSEAEKLAEEALERNRECHAQFVERLLAKSTISGKELLAMWEEAHQ